MRSHVPRSRWLAAGAVAAVAATLLWAAPADAAGPLVSRGKPVTASSTESAAAFPASAAVDGNTGTRWSSAFSDPQWIQVDLGARTAVDQVTITWEAAYARAFQVQVSDDASTWTTVYSTTTGTGGVQALPVSGTGRYVRLNLTARATQWGHSLWELEVFGTTPGGGDPGGPGGGQAQLLSYGKAGAASTYQNDGACSNCSPAKAFDRDPATRWATSPTNGWVDPGWISVDLGAPATISRVVLQWDPAFATAYQLQVSDDNATWRT